MAVDSGKAPAGGIDIPEGTTADDIRHMDDGTIRTFPCRGCDRIWRFEDGRCRNCGALLPPLQEMLELVEGDRD